MERLTFKSFNLVGRLFLLKYMLQFISMYQLLALSTPKSIYKNITILFKNFVLRGKKNDKKSVLVSSKNLCIPNLVGGLQDQNFRNIYGIENMDPSTPKQRS